LLGKSYLERNIKYPYVASFYHIFSLKSSLEHTKVAQLPKIMHQSGIPRQLFELDAIIYKIRFKI
jgi:hypothetical protein